MGMFDYINCKYPLPIQGERFQTKDTPAQYLDLYEIREDGALWHKAYDTDDQSDPEAEGFAALFGSAARVNERWEPCPFLGEIRFYTSINLGGDDKWLEYSAYFVGGKLQQLHQISP